jgi:hypothetical protein
MINNTYSESQQVLGNGRRLALRVNGSPVASENRVFFFMNDHLGGSKVTACEEHRLKYVTGGLSKVGELRYKAWGESQAADYKDTLPYNLSTS